MKFCHISPVLFGCVFAASLSSTPAQAQTSTQPNELQAIYACKAIVSPDKRLDCYDSTVGRFEAAEKSGEVVTVSKTAIEKVERDAFGFNIPSLPSLGKLFGGGTKKSAEKNALTDPVKETSKEASIPSLPKSPAIVPIIKKPKPSDIEEVNLVIRKTTKFGRDKTRFFMTNGQVWEQVSTIRAPIPKIREGKTYTAEISKAALGSFLLRVNGKGAAIRVRRVR